MPITPKLIEKLKSTFKGTYLLYPIIIIFAIPLLLIINTVWNLKNFNRDINFLLRHQAVSVTDTIKPQIVRSLNDGSDLSTFLNETKASNSEILSISVVKETDNKVSITASTQDAIDLANLEKMGLNQLAVGFNQP